jgi:uncharacterized coiled-coil protein SlyX
VGRLAVNEESLEQLQFKIAFLEQANADLSDVVFRQQQDIDALAARIQEIAERLASAQAQAAAQERAPEPEERPPHY